MNSPKILTFFCLIGLLFSFNSCTKSQKMQSANEGGAVKYFSGWSGYSIPMRPKGEISKEETHKLDAYYVGTFEGGLLVSFEKFLHQERLWTDYYTYWENSKKIRKRKMVREDGEVQIQSFVEDGKLIKEE